MPASAITPVTVLTGFLGSGKTTLLARLLREPRWRDTAVIVNEWGEAPLDHHLVREASANVTLLPSGCLCCRVAGDLVLALRELYAARLAGSIAPFGRVVVETTGLADPGPVLAILAELPLVAARYALSGVVATVDAVHGCAQLREHAEARAQVAMADRVVITKADRAAAGPLAEVEARVRALNPAAPIARSAPQLPLPEALLEAGLYRGTPAAADATGWLHSGAYRRAAAPGRHDPGIASFVWSAAEPFEPASLEPALRAVAEAAGSSILRLKGLAHVRGEPGPRAVHAVGHTLYPSARLARWPDADRSSRLVFIGRGLEEDRIASILDSFRSR